MTVRFGFENWLAPSRYTLTRRRSSRAPSRAASSTRREDLASLIVRGAAHATGGVVDLPTELEVERA